VSTSTPDTSPALQTGTLTADYVVVPDAGSHDEAVYKVVPGDLPTERTGTLVHTSDGSSHEFTSGLETMGATVERIEPLRLEATGFPQTLDLTAPMTAETALVAKAAELHARAERQNHHDALGGGWGTAGRESRIKAEAFEEALEIVRRFQ
jgi:hypothetical protein